MRKCAGVSLDGHDHEMSTEERTPEIAWPGGIAAITLFVEDLETAKRFYQDVFDLPVFFEDANSSVFKFRDTVINLLRTTRGAQPHRTSPGSNPRGWEPISTHTRRRRRRRDVRATPRTRRRTTQRADGQTMGNPHREFPRSRRAHLGDRALRDGTLLCASVGNVSNVLTRSAAATGLDLRASPTRARPDPDRQPPCAPTPAPRGRASPAARRGSAAPPADT